MELVKNIELSKKYQTVDALDYVDGVISSLAIVARPGVNITYFAVDKGEVMATHKASGDAIVSIIEGEVNITLEGVVHNLKGGETIIMPSGLPHKLEAITRFKMMLTVVK